MSSHLFLDESKQNGYVIAVAVVSADRVAATRKAVRALAMPGQARMHFQKERPARRRQVMAALVSLEVKVRLYVAGDRHRYEAESRHACLSAVVRDAATEGRLLVLEQDESRRRWDSQVLVELTRVAGCDETLRYEHQRGSAEPLPWIPDAAAWCWARGKEWRKLGSQLTESIHEV